MHSMAAAMAWLALMCGYLLPARPAAAAPQEQKKSQPKKQADAMTGCIDEQDGRYVLINDRDRSAIADLEAEGFPTEGFAKHVGHKVTVRGSSTPASGRPLFRVRSIETINESCEPPRN